MHITLNSYETIMKVEIKPTAPHVKNLQTVIKSSICTVSQRAKFWRKRNGVVCTITVSLREQMIFFLRISAREENRMKIGVDKGSMKQKYFFYNEFISGILFNKDSSDTSDLIRECVVTLERVSIVTLELTQADAIVYSKVSAVAFDVLTGIGGLLSLYLGFSFLSIAEVVDYVLQTCLALARICKRILTHK